MRKRFVLIVAAAALLALPQLASSRVVSNTVAATSELSRQGRSAEVGVLLACDRDQKAKLQVSVSQRSGAFAQRKRKVSCAAAQRRFAVKATLRGRIRLEPGEATACVLALTRDDAVQWCKDITLE